MSGPADPALNDLSQAIDQRFAAAGFDEVAVAHLQPADLMLHLYGEDIRGRAFLFEDEDESAFCLRPDFTVPVARSYLSDDATGGLARRRYQGPVFRKQRTGSDRPVEYLQAGVELFGADAATGEAEIYHLVREVLTSSGAPEMRTTIGDLDIIFALLNAIDMPDSWRARLRRHFWRPELFRDLLTQLGAARNAEGAPRQLAFLKAIGGLAPDQAHAAVRQTMALSGATHTGARTQDEVAERLLDLSRDATAHPLPAETVALIEAVLAVEGAPDSALDELQSLTSAGGVDITGALSRLETRLGALEGPLHFAAGFGRGLEYYDGFVFEFTATGRDDLPPLAGGGRYDSLLTAMGSKAGTTAVGAIVRPEALLAAGGHAA